MLISWSSGYQVNLKITLHFCSLSIIYNHQQARRNQCMTPGLENEILLTLFAGQE